MTADRQARGIRLARWTARGRSGRGRTAELELPKPARLDAPLGPNGQAHRPTLRTAIALASVACMPASRGAAGDTYDLHLYAGSAARSLAGTPGATAGGGWQADRSASAPSRSAHDRSAPTLAPRSGTVPRRTIPRMLAPLRSARPRSKALRFNSSSRDSQPYAFGCKMPLSGEGLCACATMTRFWKSASIDSSKRTWVGRRSSVVIMSILS